MSLLQLQHPLASTEEQLRVLEGEARHLKRFDQALQDSGLQPLTATGIQVLQINVGKLCNQTCQHCYGCTAGAASSCCGSTAD